MERKKIKGKALKLRRKGHSLNELSRALNVPKTTLQGWIRGIKLPKYAIERLQRRINEGRIKGNSNRRLLIPNYHWIDSEPSTRLTRFLANSLFDGFLDKDKVVNYSSHLSLAQQFAKDGEILFKLTPKWSSTKEQVHRVFLYSKNLVDFVRLHQPLLLTTIASMREQRQVTFLRAFFDDEGSVTYRENLTKRVVRGYQKDVSVLMLIQQLLFNLGIRSSLENLQQSPEIVIRDQKSLQLFAKRINFSPGVIFRALRRNSYYSSPIEKRVILKRLLNSYVKGI